jgi:hypothetical protein
VCTSYPSPYLYLYVYDTVFAYAYSVLVERPAAGGAWRDYSVDPEQPPPRRRSTKRTLTDLTDRVLQKLALRHS